MKEIQKKLKSAFEELQDKISEKKIRVARKQVQIKRKVNILAKVEDKIPSVFFKKISGPKFMGKI